MAKEKHIQTKGRIEDVPPHCFMKPGMTAMEAAGRHGAGIIAKAFRP